MNGKAMFSGVLLAAILLSGVLAWPGGARGEQIQWLSYRSSADLRRQTRIRPGGQTLKVSTEKPDDPGLPSLTSPDPLFAKWPTPMIPGGHLWLALDTSRKGGPYDRLYIDSDADGSLADEAAVKANRPDAPNETALKNTLLSHLVAC